MKFAHSFETALHQEDYPLQWVESAVPYRLLKKCIKKVQQDLYDIGTTIASRAQLWQTKGADPGRGRLDYEISDDIEDFDKTLKLTLIVDSNAALPVGVSLAPATRTLLWNSIQKSSQFSSLDHPSDYRETFELGQNRALDDTVGLGPCEIPASGRQRCSNTPNSVEISLSSNTRFFKILVGKLSALSNVQHQEQLDLTDVILLLGRKISDVVEPARGPKQTDLYAWREIFALYAECQIFFSTSERAIFSRDSLLARAQLEAFSTKLNERELVKKFRRRDSRSALETFVRVNVSLLRYLRFQELNVLAITKILKKFDKRTALDARKTFANFATTEPFSASTLVKAICFQVSDKLLATVPQLDDYLCPICCSLAFKPIRLICGHVFCIRCTLTLQRANEDHCPLCRRAVVLKADSANLDPALTNLCKRYFPIEVKAKQKANEHEAAIDQFGESFTRGICRFM